MTCTEKYREIIFLYFFGHYRQWEIGEMYGRCRSTTGYQIHRTLKLLRKKWRCFHIRNQNLIPYETIVRVTEGDLKTVDEVLRYHSRRIHHAAIENGHINPDTEDSIKSRLVAALFKFRFVILIVYSKYPQILPC